MLTNRWALGLDFQDSPCAVAEPMPRRALIYMRALEESVPGRLVGLVHAMGGAKGTWESQSLGCCGNSLCSLWLELAWH